MISAKLQVTSFLSAGGAICRNEKETRGVSGAILRGEAVEKPYGAMVNSF